MSARILRAIIRVWIGLGFLVVAAVAMRASESPLAWDAVEKSFSAKPGEKEALIPFTVTNRSDKPVEVRSVSTSCHCTEAMMPRIPWVLAPGGSDTLVVRVDLTNRRATLTKMIYLDTSVGDEILTVHVRVPPPPAVMREMNLQIAKSDRQAVLRGDCASCHVTPTVGKQGAELFTLACMICHGAATRDSMVPDLTKPKTHRDAAFWTKWIREGGENTLMPAFAKANGGSLDDAQIDSLVKFLVANLPADPAKANP